MVRSYDAVGVNTDATNRCAHHGARRTTAHGAPLRTAHQGRAHKWRAAHKCTTYLPAAAGRINRRELHHLAGCIISAVERPRATRRERRTIPRLKVSFSSLGIYLWTFPWHL